MKKKLFLKEDLAEDVIVADDREVKSESDEVLPLSNMISSMIKGEWDAIDLYNSVIATVEQSGFDSSVISTLKDIVGEEYVHVGQLEKLLQGINIDSANIDDGREEQSLSNEDDQLDDLIINNDEPLN